jgi:uncharacterized membrane protein YcaP (DUF421 family)
MDKRHGIRAIPGPAKPTDPDPIGEALCAIDAAGRRAIRQLTAALLVALVTLASAAVLLGAPVVPLAAMVGLALVTSGPVPAFLRRLRRSR